MKMRHGASIFSLVCPNRLQTISCGTLVLILGVRAQALAEPPTRRSDSAAVANPDESAAAEGAVSRHVPLDGQSNFRDIGGYRGHSGRTVLMGKLFRSGKLSALTDSDVKRVEETGVKTVVNFLTEPEIRSGEVDRLPDGCELVELPIETDGGLAAIVLQARKTGDFSSVDASLNNQIHRMLVHQATDQYAALIRTIIKSDDPLVFHCSHGVHRTGTAAAVLLWALGVSWDDIRTDYLLSNRYRKDEVDARLAQLRELAAKNQRIKPDEVEMANLKAFYRLEPSYIDAARDAILNDFGGIEGYLRDGLKLTPDEINALRNRLLSPEIN